MSGDGADPRGDFVESATRIVLRPMANPLPLGFIGLAAATLLVAALQLGWVAKSESQSIELALVAFVFPLQLLACVFGFLSRDVIAGTGMGILAGTWLTVGVIGLSAPPGTTSDGLGLLLVVAAAAILIPAAGAATAKLIATAVLATTSVRFAVTGVYELNGSAAWQDLAGVVGVALCGLALYAALAMALEDAKRKPVMPVGRRGAGKRALAGDPAAQVQRLEHEAGVREQL